VEVVDGTSGVRSRDVENLGRDGVIVAPGSGIETSGGYAAEGADGHAGNGTKDVFGEEIAVCGNGWGGVGVGGNTGRDAGRWRPPCRLTRRATWRWLVAVGGGRQRLVTSLGNRRAKSGSKPRPGER